MRAWSAPEGTGSGRPRQPAVMGLTLAQRQAASVAIATRYKRSGRAAKGRMLDEWCATGWHPADTYRELNPAAIQRQTQALTE